MKSKIASVALRTSVLYAVVAALWILLSTRILVAFVSDQKTLSNLEIYKGWVFVAFTGLLLYFFLRRQLRRLEREVTERKRAEEALRLSEESQRAVLENQTEIICRFKTDHTFTFVNDEFCRFFKKNREELLGSNQWHPDALPGEPPLMEQRIQSLTRANPIRLTENRVRSGSGEVRWMQFSNRAFFNGENRLVEIQCVGRDITERKQAEEALRNNERLLRLVMDLVPLFIFVKDKKSRHLLVNRACAEAANLTPEQMVGLSDLDMAPGSAQAEAFMKDDQEVIASGRPKFVEEKLIDARGQTRILHTTKIPFPSSTITFPVGDNGKPAILGVSADITSLKEAEAALNHERLLLRTLIDLLPEALYVKDLNSRFLVVNKALARGYFGKENPTEVLGLSDKDFFPPAMAESFRAAEEKVFAGEPLIDQEERVDFADGRKRTLLTTKVPFRDSQGNICGLVGIGRDITERKQAELQLAESRNYLLKIIDSIADPIFVKDRQHNWVLLNDAFCELMGHKREELLGKSDCDFFPRGEAEVFWTKDEVVFTTGKENVNEEMFTDGKGETHAIMTKKALYTDERGERFIVGVIRDITERKRAAEAIAHERQLLRTLIDLLPETFYVKNLEGRFLVANEALARNFGVASPAQILGKTDGDFFPAEVAARFRAQELKVFSGEPLLDYEGKGTSPNGRLCTHLTTKVPFRDSQGRIQGLVGIGRDITERLLVEEAHARLATAVQQAAEAIIVTDSKGTILYVNPAFERISGYISTEVVGQNPRILKSGKHDATFYQRMWNVLSRGKVWTGRITNKKKNGAFYEEETTISPVFDTNGNLANYVAVKRDVTQEVALETQLRQAQKMEIIGQLAGGVAHDFNNILTVIQGNASLLLNAGLKSAEDTECIQQIVQAAERATALTRQLLMFSRKQVMQPANLNLNEVVAQMAKMLRRILGENISMQSNYAANLPLIYGDVGMLEQVLMNLVVNARDAMPAGGSLTIATGVKTVDEEQAAQNPGALPGLHVWLAVSDTGCGIASENLPRIFEPFFTTKEVGKGTGLGLATVYGIIQQHHGWITVDSEVNKGTRLQIYFPAVAETRAEKKAEPLLA